MVLVLERDYEGVNDGLPVDAQPDNLLAEHGYNLRNQGWIDPDVLTPQTGINPQNTTNQVSLDKEYRVVLP